MVDFNKKLKELREEKQKAAEALRQAQKNLEEAEEQRDVFWDEQIGDRFVYHLRECRLNEARLLLPSWKLPKKEYGATQIVLHLEGSIFAKMSFRETSEEWAEDKVTIDWRGEWKENAKTWEEGEGLVLKHLEDELLIASCRAKTLQRCSDAITESRNKFFILP